MNLTGAEKTAILLLSLETDVAARLVQSLDDSEMREISRSMANLGKVSSATTEKVVIEFAHQMNETLSVIGNLNNTESFLRKVLSDDKVNSILEEMRGPIGRNTWDKLARVTPRILANYLKNEHPQTIALIMTKLPPQSAAKLMSIMSSEIIEEVLPRILNLSSVKEDVVENIEQTIKNEFINNLNIVNGVDNNVVVAEIFNNLDRSNEERFMSLLEAKDNALAVRVRKLMFTFTDLLKISAVGIQALIRTVDKSKLAVALKDAPENILEYIAQNMSQRAYKLLVEEIDNLGEVKIRDIDAARNYVITTAKEMLRFGSISLMENSEEDFV